MRALAFAACLLVVALWLALALAVARECLRVAGEAGPLSWASAGAALAFAAFVAASAVVLLAAVAVILSLAERGRCRC